MSSFIEIPGSVTAPQSFTAGSVFAGIKATNKITDMLTASIRHQSEIAAFADRVYQHARRPDRKVEGEDLTARDVLGMAIRRWGPTWRSQVMYSLLVEIANDAQSESKLFKRGIYAKSHPLIMCTQPPRRNTPRS